MEDEIVKTNQDNPIKGKLKKIQRSISNKSNIEG
jgi:hypothetical protein